MKTKLSKSMLMTALICGTIVPVLCGSASVYAEEAKEEAMSAFELDPMIVTATKSEMKTLEVPASVEVIDRERIENSGAGNAFEVMTNALGVMTHSQGVSGMSMGSMTSRVMIRGVEKGTLVMVNGVRLNQDGKYNLEDIPAEAIERIEIVRGGGSVLYGSEATGGVVNIITKKNMKNSVKIEAGNYNRQRYAANLSFGKFSAVVNYQHKGKVSDYAASTTKVYDYLKGTQKGILWNYQINDALTFTHNYSKDEHRISARSPKTGIQSDGSRYYDTDQSFLLRYDKDGWKGHLSYGTQEKAYDKDTHKTPYLYSWRKGHNTEFDISKSVNLGKNQLLVGANYQREDMDMYSYNKGPFDSTYKRNIYSLYASFNWQMGQSDNLIFNARETWVRNVNGTQYNYKTKKTTRSDNDSMSKFTPEVQYIHKISDDSRLYAKVGKSFRIPELTKIYGSGSMVRNLNLKPEQGTHFEIGYKKDFNKADFRVALFSFRIKDAIDLVSGNPIEGNCVYDNTDVRNSGIEVEAGFRHDANWSSRIGVSYGRPQQRSLQTFGDDKWHDYLNRYQLMGSVNYQKGKFKSMLSVNFNGDRSANDAKLGKLKPQCFTDLHLSYSPATNHKVFFHLNNLFNRKDWLNSGTPGGTSAYYYSLGRNFMAGYEFTF